MTPDDPGRDGSGDRTDQVGALSLDACLELLADRQRRLILGFFLDSGREHAPVDEIVSEIITDEARATGERPGHDSIALTLFHVHLPKFADAGVLEYDTRHLEIRYHGDPRIEEVYAKIQELE